MPKRQKKKPGRPSYRDKAALPRYPSHKKKVQANANLAKTAASMSHYRKGFRLMWRTVPKTMRRMKVGELNSFDKRNGHGGVMPGWPNESTLTNLRASKIFFGCITSCKLTKSQLEKVRNALGYLFELTGKRTKQKTNWPCIAQLMNSIRPGQIKKNKQGTGSKARYIPTPKQLKAAIHRGWTPQHPWPLMKWCTHYLCFYDTMVCGGRAKIDMKKVKESSKHEQSFKQGWQKTAFKGGRAKLHTQKRGTRPWSMWRVSDGNSLPF